MFWYRRSGLGNYLPEWLADLGPVGNISVHQHHTDGGRVVGMHDAYVYELPPAEAEWRDCADGWQVAMCGPWDVRPLIRQQLQLDMVEVKDARGRSWHAPIVLQPYPLTGLAFDVPLGKNWAPEPDEAQASLIGASRWARDVILRGIGAGIKEDNALLRGVDVSVDAVTAGNAAADMLAAVYHIHPSIIQALRLFDRQLLTQILLAASGLSPAIIARIQADRE